MEDAAIWIALAAVFIALVPAIATRAGRKPANRRRDSRQDGGGEGGHATSDGSSSHDNRDAAHAKPGFGGSDGSWDANGGGGGGADGGGGGGGD